MEFEFNIQSLEIVGDQTVAKVALAQASRSILVSTAQSVYQILLPVDR